MNVLITGGTGWIGSHLIKILLAEDHTILATTRNSHKINAPSRPDLTWIDWPDYHEDLNFDLNKKIDAVIHLMGESIGEKRWTEDIKKKIYESRAISAQKISKFVKENKIPVLISASAVGYYGNRGEELLTEASSPGRDFLAKVCVDWEKEVLSTGKQLRCSVLRFGLVLGKDGGALKKMALPYKIGLGGTLGDGEQWLSWIHLNDVLKMLVFAVNNDSVSGVLNAVSPRPIKQKVFSKTLSEVLHRPHFIKIPKVALKMTMGKMSNLLLNSSRVESNRWKTLNFKYEFSHLEDALSDIFDKV